MIPSLAAKSMEEALTELTERLEEEGFIMDGRQVLEEALKRETLASTAVDHGLAFPHVRGVEGGGLTMTMGISSKGIRFDPGSRSLTRVIFFMVIPTAASGFYLKLLAGLNQTFRDKDYRTQLMEASTAEDLWKVLNRLTRSSVK
jgi:mannitol/fructose-specific phosphotransferase system IIA component (Ntr-type)